MLLLGNFKDFSNAPSHPQKRLKKLVVAECCTRLLCVDSVCLMTVDYCATISYQLVTSYIVYFSAINRTLSLIMFLVHFAVLMFYICQLYILKFRFSLHGYGRLAFNFEIYCRRCNELQQSMFER